MQPLKHLDLNLLRVLQALYEERSALRAGERLGVTASAVSHALGRLREHFGDRLFVRGAGGLQPTARATEIAPVIAASLARMEEALAPSRFDPGTTSRIFTIAAPLYLCELLLVPVIAQVRAAAPLAQVRLWNTTDLARSLDEGKVDIGIGSFEVTTPRFSVEALLEDELVWVAAPTTLPKDRTLTPERIAAMPRVMVAAMKDYQGVGGRVEDTGIRRRIASGSDELLKAYGVKAVSPAPISVFDALTAVAMAKALPVLAYVPRRLADAHRGALEICDAVEPRTPFSTVAIWRSDMSHDPALQWLRALLVAAAAQVSGAASTRK